MRFLPAKFSEKCKGLDYSAPPVGPNYSRNDYVRLRSWPEFEGQITDIYSDFMVRVAFKDSITITCHQSWLEKMQPPLDVAINRFVADKRREQAKRIPPPPNGTIRETLRYIRKYDLA